jgi:biotin operon repressor
MQQVIEATRDKLTASEVLGKYGQETARVVSAMQDQQVQNSEEARVVWSDTKKNFSQEGWLVPSDNLRALFEQAKVTLPELETLMPDVAKQLRESAANPGADVVVSHADLLAHILHMDGFLEQVGGDMHLPGAISLRGAKVMQKWMDEVLAAGPDNPKRRVYEDIYAKLVKEGTKENVAERAAVIWSHAMEGLGNDVNLPADEYYAQHQIEIEREGISKNRHNVFVQRATQLLNNKDAKVQEGAYATAAKEAFGETGFTTYRVVQKNDAPSHFAEPSPDLQEPAKPAPPKHYDRAQAWVATQETVSAQSLRNELRISKADTNKLIARLEADGVLGPATRQGRKVIRQGVVAPEQSVSEGPGTPVPPAGATQAAPPPVSAIPAQETPTPRTVAEAGTPTTPAATPVYVLKSGDHYLNMDDAIVEAQRTGGEILVVQTDGKDVIGVKGGMVTLKDVAHERVIQPGRGHAAARGGRQGSPGVHHRQRAQELVQDHADPRRAPEPRHLPPRELARLDGDAGS